VLPRFGSYRLGRLPADEIESWLNDEIAAGIAPSSVHRHYRTLRRTLQVAVEKQKLVAKPCDRVQPPRVATREMVFLTWEEAVDLAESIHERDLPPTEGVAGLVRPGWTVWFDVQGFGSQEWLTSLGRQLGIHPLAMADIVNVGQRAKVDDFGETLLCVLRMATLTPPHAVEWEQMSVVIGRGWVLTAQETYGDCLDPLRRRLREGIGSIRSHGSDFLGTMILDGIIDAYFPILEVHGDQLEGLEARVIARPDQRVLAEIYRMKRALLAFRRASWPLREALSQVLRNRPKLLGEGVYPYLRDAEDHVIQVSDVVESYREIAASFIDVYISAVSQRTNEIMRVLTVISTIFIPLTFLAGVYGMNFHTDKDGNMPELDWPYAYLLFWGVSLAVAGALLVGFWRAGWIGRGRQPGGRRRA